MKTLTVAALLCAVAALTAAAALSDVKEEPEEQPQEALSDVKEEPEALETPQEGEHHVVKRATSCPWNWYEIDGRCFLYVKEKMSWVRAEKNCQSMGANLASVHSRKENHGIKRMILDETGYLPEAWIGGSDGGGEGHWLWSDGSSFHYSYWCGGEPNNLFFQHCLAIHYGGWKCWDDKWCWKRYPSVCADSY